MKLLFDLFPILLFFVAYKLGDANPESARMLLAVMGVALPATTHPGIFIATAVAIVATFMQIGWVWMRHRKVDTMLWVSLVLILVFGGATLVFHDPLFIKWKPTILYWLFAAVLLVAEVLFRKNLISAMMKGQIRLPEPIWRRLNFAWVLFFMAMGAINLYVAYAWTESAWVNFKLFGFMGLMLAFVVAQGFFLARHIQDEEPR